MQNVTVRPLLWTHKKNKEGLCPLMLCITIKRAQSYQKTGYYLRPDQWDAEHKEIKNFGNNRLANDAVAKQVRECRERITQAIVVGEKVTANIIKGSDPERQTIGFEEYAKLIRYDKTRVNRILAFKPKLRMDQIDLAFLRALDSHEKERGSHPNTIHSTFKYLGQLLRAATNEEIMKKNPMNLFKMPKYTKPERDYLVNSELKALWKLLDKNLPVNTRATLIYFLLACYSGLRHSDWSTFDAETMYSDGLLRLRAWKNKQDVVIPVGKTLDKVINLTKGLPPALSNQKCNGHLKIIAGLAKLDKNITCHTARHTAGNYFASEAHLTKSVVAKLLAITESTAEVYFHLSGANIMKEASVLATL